MEVNFIEQFDREFAPRLAYRKNTFRKVFELLNNKKALIVETGTTRDKGNWNGDGQSTILWDAYVNWCGGEVFSVDCDPKAVVTAMNVTSPKTFVVCYDSIKYLKEFPRKNEIDLLYLDSLDANIKGAAYHNFMELLSVWNELKAGCIIMVDDCCSDDHGKHLITQQFMKDMGYKPIMKDYQTIWIK